MSSSKNFSQNFLRVKRYLTSLQKSIRRGLEEVGGEPFQEIRWKHREKGGGLSLLIESNPGPGSMEGYTGNNTGKKKRSPVFEKGGVNISAVGGELPESMSTLLNVRADRFSACGLSLVIHPFSPLIPTIHMNVRYFEMDDGNFWFGGGVDLTPYYPDLEGFRHFHYTVHQAVCQVYPHRYREFKEKCDQYFTLPHRQEMRGIGGVFFDYLKNNYSLDFDLIRSLGDSFLSSYLPLVKKNLKRKFSEKEKAFQLYRRGRYVEFNLLYDRGTLFGLKTGGRVDSILMSLPPLAKFLSHYRFPESGFEKQMAKYYQPYEWVKGNE